MVSNFIPHRTDENIETGDGGNRAPEDPTRHARTKRPGPGFIFPPSSDRIANGKGGRTAVPHDIPSKTRRKVSMAEDERNAEMEDIAQDAVNELLGMYGYEGVRKDEFKSSLRNRRLPFDMGQLPVSTSGYHPYLPLPVNTLLMAATSATTTSTKPGTSKGSNSQPTKISKPKTGASTATGINSAARINADNANRNLQLCQWCKKEKAQIIETLPPSASGDIFSPVGLIGLNKLKFCSMSCLNAYKLDIFRQETEACLRSGNVMGGNKGDKVTCDEEESKSNFEMSSLVKSVKTVLEEYPVPKVNPPKVRPQISPPSTDLWTCAVGNGKKLAGRSSNASKNGHHSSGHSGTIEESKSSLTTTGNTKQQQRSKKRSTPPRPHPYYALNKKYWMNLRGGDCQMEETKEKQENRSVGETGEDSLSASSTATFSLRAVLPVPQDDLEKKEESKSKASDGTAFAANSNVPTDPQDGSGESDEIQICHSPRSNGKDENRQVEEETDCSPTAAVSNGVLSFLPLNLVWIPVPVPLPIPLPIPIPIPISVAVMDQTNENRGSGEMMEDNCQD